MGKLIAKTAAATLGAIISVLLVVFLILHFFVPSAMVKVTTSFGMEKLALKYSIKTYEKSEDLSDLQDVLYRANELEDYSVIVKYSPSMYGDDKFLTFCDAQQSGEISYKSYVLSNYIFALNEEGVPISDIIAKTKYLYDNFYGTGFEQFNPYHALCMVLTSPNAEVVSLLTTIVCDGEEAVLRDYYVTKLTA